MSLCCSLTSQAPLVSSKLKRDLVLKQDMASENSTQDRTLSSPPQRCTYTHTHTDTCAPQHKYTSKYGGFSTSLEDLTSVVTWEKEVETLDTEARVSKSACLVHCVNSVE